jgi:hypothetical protein
MNSFQSFDEVFDKIIGMLEAGRQSNERIG